jgi:predicted  nucleic acid-binding Zn-ribbon protein
MRTEASIGRVPHAYRGDHDYPTTHASAATSIKADVARAVDTAVKPLQDEITAANNKIAAAETKLKDVSEKRIAAAASQERKTLSPAYHYTV